MPRLSSLRPISLGALVAGLLPVLLAACEHYEPREFTSKSRPHSCQDCPPGLFSGEDGRFVIVGEPR